MAKKMTGYDLSRNFFDWCFENPELVRPIHIALYFFAVEHCNRLGWKEKFGFPTQMTMDAIGVKNWRTYIKALNDLVEWGFFELLEKSKNQYSANVIAIVKNTKANTKALTKAQQKHIQKHSRSTYKSTVDINKHINKEPINNINSEDVDVVNFDEALEIAKKINEWAKGYFHEKYISEGSLDVFEKLIRIDGYQENDIRVAIEWARSDDFWSTNFLSPVKLRSKDKNGVKYIDVFLAKTIKRNGKQASRKGATWEDIAEVASTGFDQR